MPADVAKLQATAVVHKFTDEQHAAVVDQYNAEILSRQKQGATYADTAAALQLPEDRVLAVLHGNALTAEDIHGSHLIQAYPDHEVVDGGTNLITKAGLTQLVKLLNKQAVDGITATTARLGVGDGVGTAAVGDTDLSAAAGATHRQFVIMDGSFPSVAGAVLSLQATFTSALANFAWNEWGIDIGAATVVNGTTVNACLFDHKTSVALGTKSTGSWVLAVTVTES